MASEAIAYNRKELRDLIKAFKAMSDQAVEEAKRESNALAQYAADKIKVAAAGRQVSSIAANRIASGVRVSKSSKVGEFSYGFASQRFSGGATTRDLVIGMEFGSRKFKQFPMRSPIVGRGNAGYFIYPTLKSIQPYIIEQWEQSFSRILKEYN
jgi:hypothetical protein